MKRLGFSILIKIFVNQILIFLYKIYIEININSLNNFYLI